MPGGWTRKDVLKKIHHRQSMPLVLFHDILSDRHIELLFVLMLGIRRRPGFRRLFINVQRKSRYQGGNGKQEMP